MKKLRLICILMLTIVFICSLSSAGLASYDGVEQTRFLAVTYQLVPFTLSFTQRLGTDFSVNGSYIYLSAHYNDGLLKNYYGYPFSWNVYSVWFKWYENSVEQHSFSSFSRDYQVIYPPSDRLWGGRNRTSVTFYLPGNYHGAKIYSQYISYNTIPGFWNYYLEYGQL